MSCILIIGYGNPLRGDDGFGWLLAERLKRKFCDCDIEVLAAHQLTPEMAEPISRARYVIFADASVKPDVCGVSLKKLRVSDSGDSAFSHQSSPEALAQMAQTLYGASPHALFMLTAQAFELGYQEKLSPEMERELDCAVERISALCEFLSPTIFNHSVVTTDS